MCFFFKANNTTNIVGQLNKIVVAAFGVICEFGCFRESAVVEAKAVQRKKSSKPQLNGRKTAESSATGSKCHDAPDDGDKRGRSFGD